MTKEEYQEYLQSPHWKRIQYTMYHIVTEDCELCGQPCKKLNIHHLNYNSLWHEEYKDLVVLCEDCHKMAHNEDIEIKRRYNNRFVSRSVLFNTVVYSDVEFNKASTEITYAIEDGYIKLPFEDTIVSLSDVLERVMSEIIYNIKQGDDGHKIIMI